MAAGTGLGGELPVVSGITGTTRLAPGGPYSQYDVAVGYKGLATMDNTPVGYSGSVATGSTMLGPAIQTIGCARASSRRLNRRSRLWTL